MSVGLSSFSLLKALSQAYDGVETNFLGSGNLGGDGLVGFAVLDSSLRVADEDPLDIEIFELLTADLSSEGTVGCGAHVLGADLNVFVQKGFD